MAQGKLSERSHKISKHLWYFMCTSCGLKGNPGSYICSRYKKNVALIFCTCYT